MIQSKWFRSKQMKRMW